MDKKRRKIFNALMVLMEAMNEEEGHQIIIETFEFLKECEEGEF